MIATNATTSAISTYAGSLLGSIQTLAKVAKKACRLKRPSLLHAKSYFLAKSMVC